MNSQTTDTTGVDGGSAAETPSEPETRTSEGRSTLATIRLGIFGLALALAGVMTVLFLPGLLALLVLGWTAQGAAELGVHRLHVMGIAAVVAVTVAGLFVQAHRPTRRVAAIWGAFLTLVVVSAGTVAYGVGRPEEVLPFLVVAGVMLLAHPAGRAVLRRGDTSSPALLALVGVAAVPLVAFAIGQFALSSSASDPHAVDGHYVMMAGLALAPIAYGLFAAFGFAGWRLAAWLAALPMAYYGLMSVSFLSQVGSSGTTWGLAAVLWAVAFVAVAEYSRVSTSTVVRRETARAS